MNVFVGQQAQIFCKFFSNSAPFGRLPLETGGKIDYNTLVYA